MFRRFSPAPGSSNRSPALHPLAAVLQFYIKSVRNMHEKNVRERDSIIIILWVITKKNWQEEVRSLS